MGRKVFVVGVGMTKFAKHLDRGIKSLVREALSSALKDAGVPMDILEADQGICRTLSNVHGSGEALERHLHLCRAICGSGNVAEGDDL